MERLLISPPPSAAQEQANSTHESGKWRGSAIPSTKVELQILPAKFTLRPELPVRKTADLSAPKSFQIKRALLHPFAAPRSRLRSLAVGDVDEKPR